MFFWIAMLVCVLLIPAIMIFAGWFMEKHCPKDINWIIGYRTERSMKNMDTWRFANAHCGRLWQKLGWRMLPVSVIPMLLTIGAGEETVAMIGLLLCVIQLITLLASIVPTERALKEQFHQDGTRKELISKFEAAQLFYVFGNQDERKATGGSCFLEMQYCRMEQGTPIKKIVSVDAVKHWRDDSLYIDGDCTDQLQAQYGSIFTGGTYNNLKSGKMDVWGINYYSPEQVEKMIDLIKEKKPQEYETVLLWLERAKEYNGIYILGV